jgi:hypothetical protein
MELRTELYLAGKLFALSMDDLAAAKSQAEDVSRMLSGLLNSLRKPTTRPPGPRIPDAGPRSMTPDPASSLLPFRSPRPILDEDPPGFQLAPDGIGGGEVAR